MTKNHSNQHIQFDEKLFSTKKILLFLASIAISSFIIRIYFLNFEIPLTNDALNYFFYALDIKINNQLPVNYSLANPGWGIFLSTFFSSFELQNVIDYMNLQRILSVSLSTLTILPTYLLCKKFFAKPYSLLGALLIGFEPHLIQNSLFGISDSLYIFLIVISFLLFFNENKKITYISFVIIAFSTIVRSEGVFILLVFLIMIILRSDKIEKKILDITISGLIFSMIFLPMALIQIETYDSDMAFGRIIETVDNDIINQNSGHYVGIKALIFNGIQNFPTYLGWSIIPTFVFFVPIGFVLMFKNWNYRIKTIFTALVLMSMPAFYAYSISIQDGRYIFFLYPLFVILSMITIEKIGKKFNQKIIFSVIISFIIISSCVYSVLKIDNTQSEEYLLIAQRISDTPKIINDYNKSQYLEPLNYPKEFNEFKKLYELDRIDKKSIRFSVPQQISKIPVSSHQNINDFINSNKNSITHIVVENEQESIFYDIFENEDKYSYLEKEFDSSSINFQYSVKIFKINHEKFFKNDIEK
jgi:hypothetical protein